MEEMEVIVRPLERRDEERVQVLVRRVQTRMKTEEQGIQLKRLFSNPLPYGISALLILLIGFPLDLPVVAVSGCVLMSTFFFCKVQFQRFWRQVSEIFSSTREDLLDISGFYINRERRTFLVAELNKHIVGTAALRESPSGEQKTGKLLRMFVDPECRRMRVGTRLMERMFSEAKLLGYSHLELRTHETNSEAIQFYQKQGFQKTGESVFCSVFPLKLRTFSFSKQL